MGQHTPDEQFALAQDAAAKSQLVNMRHGCRTALHLGYECVSLTWYGYGISSCAG